MSSDVFKLSCVAIYWVIYINGQLINVNLLKPVGLSSSRNLPNIHQDSCIVILKYHDYIDVFNLLWMNTSIWYFINYWLVRVSELIKYVSTDKRRKNEAMQNYSLCIIFNRHYWKINIQIIYLTLDKLLHKFLSIKSFYSIITTMNKKGLSIINYLCVLITYNLTNNKLNLQD